MAKASQKLKPKVFSLAESGLTPQEIVACMPELSQATIYRWIKEYKNQSTPPKKEEVTTPCIVNSFPRRKEVA